MSALCSPDTLPIRLTCNCPVCGSDQRMAGFLQLWYGQTITCLGCGDMWTDGEMHPRPFKPRWRAENTAKAQQWWDEAEGYTDEKRSAWIQAQIEAEKAAPQ